MRMSCRCGNEPSPSLLRKSTSPEGRGLMHLTVTHNKSSPFRGSWQTRQGLTERVGNSPLFSLLCNPHKRCNGVGVAVAHDGIGDVAVRLDSGALFHGGDEDHLQL